MTFCIVSTGWRVGGWWAMTLPSVEEQFVDDWRAVVVYDGGDEVGPTIMDWGREHGPRWQVILNDHHRGAVRNQYEAIRVLAPEDDDVVVWLDLDGDRLAHPEVLADLAGAYADGTLLTYGNYRPEPDPGTCPAAEPFPPEVIAAGSYRAHMASGQPCCFNHLRTMSGRVAKAIPVDRFGWLHWPDGGWYEAGADYLFMLHGLELAGPRHKCLDEVLMIYNAAQPHPDNLTHPELTSACVQDMLSRPPLEPLP